MTADREGTTMTESHQTAEPDPLVEGLLGLDLMLSAEEAGQIAGWLRAHPGIRVIAADRTIRAGLGRERALRHRARYLVQVPCIACSRPVRAGLPMDGRFYVMHEGGDPDDTCTLDQDQATELERRYRDAVNTEMDRLRAAREPA